MKRLGIDYSYSSNSFDEIRSVKTDLIYGDLCYIENPWLSYIIPVYKRADLLEKTLKSVLDQLPVDFPWNIVVVDNETEAGNPTEQLIRRINNKRILYYRNQENIGPGGNYNRCIEVAAAPWVALLHGDDLITTDHLRLMGEHIRKYEHGKRPLAYISPRYVDFSKEDELKLNRAEWEEEDICYFGRLKKLTLFDAMMTGNTVGIPSFGTVMNREVMLRTGGFHVDLGICEDVITPYKLSKQYRVYTTPKLMGYYRFEENTCLKREVIFEICEGMTDFREYLFETNSLTRIWGNIVRPVFFKTMTIYCSHISRYGKDHMRLSEFDYIYPEKKKFGFWQRVYYTLYALYAKANGYISFEESIKREMKRVLPIIAQKGCSSVLVYGAGRAGEEVIRYLKKVPGISVLGVAVSSMGGNEKQIRGVPVRPLKEYLPQKDACFVIIAATIEEFYYDMNEEAQRLGFCHRCSIDEGIRKKEEQNENM